MIRILTPPLRALVMISALAGASFALPQSATGQAETIPDYVIAEFGAPPPIPEGALSPELEAAVTTVFVDLFDQGAWTNDQQEALATIVEAGDPRVAWLITDMMRFSSRFRFDRDLAAAGAALLGMELRTGLPLHELTDHLMAWDVPSFPGYLPYKRVIFTTFIPGWDQIFVEGEIDWRLVSWGGVLIDDRPYDRTDEACNCIPAADNPEVIAAAEADWLDDDDIVFGIEVNGETRAYPRQIMEVREMVNDTLGGRDLGIPYCTLCGAAQAYFTDELPDGVERPVLRTTGLLIRSNKVMYDVNTFSVFDTFLGHAVTGPLAEIGLRLEQVSVVTTEWGAWREAHPETTVLVEALALGHDFDFRNGRDANGPIFPVGDVDPRLPVHEDVIGVITDGGTPVAFQRSAAMAALLGGSEIAYDNVRLALDAGGIRAVDALGADLGSHQAFWFAWSQFHPDTELWAP